MPGSASRRCRLALMVAGALLLAAAAPAQARHLPGGSPDRPTLLRARVHVLDAPTLDALAGSPEGQSTLAFGAIPPKLRRLSRGDVLVGGASARAPQGLLRRVTGVARRGGSLLVETEPATLEDVFWRARARQHIPMRGATVAGATARVEGVLVPEASLQAWSPGPIEFDLLDVVLYDLDGNPSTTGDQVKVNGTLGVDPTFDVDLDVAWGQIRRFEFTNTNRISTTLELDGRVTIVDFDRTITVASVRFAPITIFVGPVPLVFTPVLDVDVSLSGHVTAGVRTSVTVGAPASVGVLYENRQWSAFARLPDGPEDLDLQWSAPELTAEAAVTLSAGPQLTVLLYDLGGPFAAVHGYSVLQAALLPSRTWSIDVGVRGNAGLVVRVPGTEERRVSFDVFDRRWRVAEGSF